MSNIYERRSIRKYTDQAVERTVIEEMIRAGAAAPSAKNRQPWKYLVYEGAAKEEFCNRMQKGLEREQTGKAVLPESAFGTLWIANTCFAYPELIDYIETDNQQLIGAITVGYPAEHPAARPRKPLEDILEYRE